MISATSTPVTTSTILACPAITQDQTFQLDQELYFALKTENASTTNIIYSGLSQQFSDYTGYINQRLDMLTSLVVIDLILSIFICVSAVFSKITRK